MPPLVGIGLTELLNSGGAKASPAPPLTTALQSDLDLLAKSYFFLLGFFFKLAPFFTVTITPHNDKISFRYLVQIYFGDF